MNLTNRQLEMYEAYLNNNFSEIATAKALKISRAAVRQNLFLVGKKGFPIFPDRTHPQAPIGFQLDKTTLYINKKGEVAGQWPRFSPEIDKLNSLITYLENRKPLTGKLPEIKTPTNVDNNLMLEWTLSDLHYGLLAWGKETGQDYDIKIARSLLIDSANDLLARSGKVKLITLVLMGDNFHTDFFSNKTEDSGHDLSVDSRYNKIVYTGIETFIAAIEICLHHAERVKVIVLYGNHDKQTSTILPMVLHYNFKLNPRIEIDLRPSKEKYCFWGCVGTIYHHGDRTKPERLCAELNNHIIENDLTGIRYRYAKQGHLHKEEIRDINGVTYEIVPSPVARDNFASSSNFSHKRATVGTLYHKDFGDCGRFMITPQGLEMKKKLMGETE